MGKKSQRERERGNLQDMELRTMKGSSGTWAGEADLG